MGYNEANQNNQYNASVHLLIFSILRVDQSLPILKQIPKF